MNGNGPFFHVGKSIFNGIGDDFIHENSTRHRRFHWQNDFFQIGVYTYPVFCVQGGQEVFRYIMDICLKFDLREEIRLIQHFVDQGNGMNFIDHFLQDFTIPGF